MRPRYNTILKQSSLKQQTERINQNILTPVNRTNVEDEQKLNLGSLDKLSLQ